MANRKGANAERELIHLFWDNGWGAIRVAGSGSVPLPVPDLLVSNGKKNFAIECKAIKADKKYFYDKEINELKEFASKFGADPIIGVRFNRIGWYFMHVDQLPKTRTSLCFSLEYAKKHGLRFDDLINKKLFKKSNIM